MGLNLSAELRKRGVKQHYFDTNIRLSFHLITVRLLLPGSLKQNWPIRLQDKNNEFQPKPIEPIMSRRKTTVKTQKFGIIHCSYPTVI